MPRSVKTGVPVIGVAFLLLGLVKLIQGESWVVWFVLGVVFGGLGIFNLKRSEGPRL